MHTIVAVALLLGPAGAGADDAVALLSQGRAAQSAGDIASARQLLHQAYQADSTDPRIRLAFAAVARDESRAGRILTALTQDSGATLSQKGQAYVLLAGIAYVKEDYLKAADLYGKAFGLSARPEDAVRQGLSAMLAGRLSEAETLFGNAVDPASEGSGAYYRALLALHRNDYAAALELFKESVELSQESAPWRPSAMAGRAICADKLGYVSTAAAFRNEFVAAYPDALEHRLFRHGFTPLPDSKERSFGGRTTRSRRRPKPQPTTTTLPARPTPGPAPDKGRYTIQVGSFGTPENARKLQSRMAEYFDNVRIVTAEVSGTRYHRVRIGQFQSREAAEKFAQERVSPTGVSHKVLQDE